jgi:hemerythrin
VTDKEIVQWHSSYSVGIPLIDEQHKELINLTNKLYESCVEGRESSKVIFMRTIRGAVDYIGYHFSTEEMVMTRINYPDYANHKKEHTEFVREVLKEVEDFKTGKKFTPNAFVRYLKDWVLAHIAVSDKRLGEYLIRMKKEGGLGGITLKVKKVTQTDEEGAVTAADGASQRLVVKQ